MYFFSLIHTASFRFVPVRRCRRFGCRLSSVLHKMSETHTHTHMCIFCVGSSFVYFLTKQRNSSFLLHFFFVFQRILKESKIVIKKAKSKKTTCMKEGNKTFIINSFSFLLFCFYSYWLDICAIFSFKLTYRAFNFISFLRFFSFLSFSFSHSLCF